jgi:hypothetical protein
MSAASPLQKLFGSPLTARFNPYSQAVFRKLHNCHTAALGWHMYRCDQQSCGQEKVQYHACGNRHCPHCGQAKRAAWVAARKTELLPTSYYHIVFTLPHEFNGLIMGNRKALLSLLFASAAETLLTLGRDTKYVGGELGITMVLHTWGQELSFHPHVHCIVSGGGYDAAQGRWIPAKRANGKFLFPISSLRKVFKGIFLKRLRQCSGLSLAGIDLAECIELAGNKQWNVYAKAPFGGPAQVIEYLGNYTHKVAITPKRIVSVTEQEVRFRYKDYADGNKEKEMTLSQEEFLRRFEQHILPRGFVKVRYYGYLRNKDKGQRLAQIREDQGLSPMPKAVYVSAATQLLISYGIDVGKCPCCSEGRLQLVTIVHPKPYSKLREFPNKASPEA